MYFVAVKSNKKKKISKGAVYVGNYLYIDVYTEKTIICVSNDKTKWVNLDLNHFRPAKAWEKGDYA